MSSDGSRRILLTGDTEGGVWTFTLDLADGLLKRGWEVCLATFGPTVTDSHSRSASEVSGLRWVHYDSKLEWMPGAWKDISCAGRWLTQVAYQHQPDLVHLNTLCHANLMWNIPVVVTHHSCVTAWWHAVKQSPLPVQWHRYRQEVEHSLKCATVLCAPTQAALTTVERNYDVDMSAARAIPNGRNNSLFRVGKKEPFILCAGRLWDEAKNARALVGIAPALPWSVHLAGDVGSTEEKDVPGCRLLGSLGPPELAKWYSRAAIYALPAFYEPFGLSILEAALSGCALVLGDIPSLRETWHGVANFVPPNDPKALQAAITRLIANPMYRIRMAENALQRANEFTQERMVDGYVSLYQSEQAKYRGSVRRHACAS